MTEEEKRLLFQDLVARLPYTPMVNLRGKAGYDRKLVSVHRYNTRSEFEVVVNSDDDEDYMPHNFEIDIVKLYLRPMSSMTEDEEKELTVLTNNKFTLRFDRSKIINLPISEIDGEWHCGSLASSVDSFDIISLIDWLLAHHFDYRGLIEKGLALKAPDGMYNKQND